MTISNNRFLEELVGQKISWLWLQTFIGISTNLIKLRLQKDYQS